MYHSLKIKHVSSILELSFWVKNHTQLNHKHIQINFQRAKTVAFQMSEMINGYSLSQQLTINVAFGGHFSTLRAENAR